MKTGAPQRILALLTAASLAVLTSIATTDTASADPGDGTLTISAVRDLDANGQADTNEDLVADLPVTIVDGAGNEVSTATSADGTVEVDLADTDLVGGQYRVQLTIPEEQAHLQPAIIDGPGFAPHTSFIDVTGGADVELTFGVWNPADYVGDDPTVATAVQNAMKNNFSTGDPTVVTFPWDARGRWGEDESANVRVVASEQETGTVYGLAWDRLDQVLYTGSFFKRWTWFAGGADAQSDPLGPGLIFRTDPEAGTTVQWGYLPSAGTELHDDGQFSGCFGFYPLIGKRGIGGMDFSDDGQTMYAINMNDGSLRCPDAPEPEYTNAIAIFDTDAAPGPDGLVLPTRQVPVPAPSNISAPENWHVMAVNVHDGVVYIGGVDSAESTQDRAT